MKAYAVKVCMENQSKHATDIVEIKKHMDGQQKNAYSSAG